MAATSLQKPPLSPQQTRQWKQHRTQLLAWKRWATQPLRLLAQWLAQLTQLPAQLAQLQTRQAQWLAQLTQLLVQQRKLLTQQHLPTEV